MYEIAFEMQSSYGWLAILLIFEHCLGSTTVNIEIQQDDFVLTGFNSLFVG